MKSDELKKIRVKRGYGKWVMAAKLSCSKADYCHYEDGKYKIPAMIVYLAKEIEKTIPEKNPSDLYKPNGRTAFLRAIEMGCEVTVKADEIPKYRGIADRLDRSRYKFSMLTKKNGYGIIKRLYY